ncbi:MAG: signal peptidase I [Oscillospiraceae bacterium]
MNDNMDREEQEATELDEVISAENAEEEKLPEEPAVEDENPEDDSENSEEKKTNGFAEGLDWVGSFVYAILAVILLNIFVFRSITVDGDSMNNTLKDQDRVIATNFFYTPQRGDIVVVQADAIPNQYGTFGEPIIKRVIGVAGDVIRFDFDNGIVYRNGEALSEDYIKEPTYYNRWLDAVSDVDYVVPEGCVYVMGDNRNNSKDSREHDEVGMVDVDLIMGKAILQIYPMNKFGLL